VRRALTLLVVLAAACSGSKAPAATPSQRVVYRDVDPTGSVSTTTVDLLPPYRARLVTRGADGSLSGFAWDEGSLYSIGASGTARTSAVAPGFAGPVSGLAVSLPVALRQHLLQRMGTSRVLGRDCVQWLSAEPLGSAPFAPATALDRTTSCVDDDGLVLQETWRAGGSLVRTRTAVEVGKGPSLEGAALLPDAPTPLPSNGAYVVRDASPADLVSAMQVPAPTAPAGFTADRSVAVLDVDPQGTGFTREAAVFTWRRGTQLAVLRLERDLSGHSKATVRGARVDLGVLGTGRLEPVYPGLRVVVDGPRGLRATATAALPEAELLAWVRTLRLQQGP
jgi:hypothetical protein